MMTREDIQQVALASNNKALLIEAATGVGKTLIALLKTKQVQSTEKILVVVPYKVLKGNWKDEYLKWGYDKYLPQTEFVCYRSFPKLKGRKFDVIIYDECHHLSPRCQAAIPYITSNINILLSATVSWAKKETLKKVFPDLGRIKVTTQDAIDSNILPKPRIIKIPLSLNAFDNSQTYLIKPKARIKITVTISEWEKWRWYYYKHKIQKGVRIICSEQDYYDLLTSDIAYNKQQYIDTVSNFSKAKWLKLENNRLKWLSDVKTIYVQSILSQLSTFRTLTFCNGIDHTERLGKYAINSKNKDSAMYLDQFNNGQINHITACTMLDEGVNLTDCQVAVFAHINASDRMQVQKVGRVLRHPNPIILLPYFKNTREEEIVVRMLEQYDASLIEVQNYAKLTL